MNNNTLTIEQIRERLRANPNGPIILWRFRSLANQDHKDNLDTLRRFLVGNTLTLDGVCWHVQILRTHEGTDETPGLVVLHRPVLHAVQAAPNTRKLEDIKAWWKAGLDARGIPLDYTHPFKPVAAPDRDDEIDYAVD